MCLELRKSMWELSSLITQFIFFNHAKLTVSFTWKCLCPAPATGTYLSWWWNWFNWLKNKKHVSLSLFFFLSFPSSFNFMPVWVWNWFLTWLNQMSSGADKRGWEWIAKDWEKWGTAVYVQALVCTLLAISAISLRELQGQHFFFFLSCAEEKTFLH